MFENAIICLGTSGGNPQPDRGSSGYLLKIGDDLSLIDCGSAVTSSFLRLGLDPFDLKRLFISHTHSDHVCELSLIVQLMSVRGRSAKLDLYLPQEFVTPFRNYLEAVYLFEDRLPFRLVMHGYEEGTIYEDDFTLEAIKNAHLAKYRDIIRESDASNLMQSYSFKIAAAERTFFYSGDVASIDDIKDHLGQCDVAIVESMHCDSNEILEIARAAESCRFILTHFGDAESRRQMEKRIIETSAANLIIAEDGLELEF